MLLLIELYRESIRHSWTHVHRHQVCQLEHILLPKTPPLGELDWNDLDLSRIPPSRSLVHQNHPDMHRLFRSNDQRNSFRWTGSNECLYRKEVFPCMQYYRFHFSKDWLLHPVTVLGEIHMHLLHDNPSLQHSNYSLRPFHHQQHRSQAFPWIHPDLASKLVEQLHCNWSFLSIESSKYHWGQFLIDRNSDVE